MTGRIKDVIIIRGRNYYPQDIEGTMERSDLRLRPGCGVAFGVDVDGEERLVAVQEIDAETGPGDMGKIIDAIRHAIASEHGLRAHAVILLPPGEISKTSSGKVQRGTCREQFLAGTLPAVATSLV